MNMVADSNYFAFTFTFKDQPYHIKVNTNTLFKLRKYYSNILFLPDYLKHKKPGDILAESEFKSDDYFLPKCSTYNAASIFRSKDTDVNRVSNNLFKSFSYYFIAINAGDFRGLLRGDDGAIELSQPVLFGNYQYGRRAARNLANGLKASSCAGLYVAQASSAGEEGKMLILSEPFLIRGAE